MENEAERSVYFLEAEIGEETYLKVMRFDEVVDIARIIRNKIPGRIISLKKIPVDNIEATEFLISFFKSGLKRYIEDEEQPNTSKWFVKSIGRGRNCFNPVNGLINALNVFADLDLKKVRIEEIVK